MTNLVNINPAILIIVASILVLIIFILTIVQNFRRKPTIIGRTAIILLVMGLLFLTLLVFQGQELGAADWAQALLMIGLVLVTALYASSAEKQANASAKMAEEMRNARYDALRPIIDIVNMQQMPIELARQAYAKEPPKELTCKLCNVGVGPAIDVYSFVYHDSGERQRHDFHTIAIGKEKGPERLSVAQKDNRWFLVAYYKDVYGRCFESSREVRGGVVNPDPLKFRNIACEELPK